MSSEPRFPVAASRTTKRTRVAERAPDVMVGSEDTGSIQFATRVRSEHFSRWHAETRAERGLCHSRTFLQMFLGGTPVPLTLKKCVDYSRTTSKSRFIVGFWGGSSHRAFSTWELTRDVEHDKSEFTAPFLMSCHLRGARGSSGARWARRRRVI